MSHERGGYIRVDWATKDSLQGSNVVSLGLWSWLMLSATARRRALSSGRVLERGDVLISSKGLAERLDMSAKTIRRYLDLWERDGAIRIIKRDRNGTHLNLCNFSTYQTIGSDAGTERELKGNETGTKEPRIGNETGTQRERNGAHTEKPNKPETINQSPKNPEERDAVAPPSKASAKASSKGTKATVKLSAEEVDAVGEFEPAELRESLSQWLRYKRRRRETYGPEGLTAALSRARNLAAEHGALAVADAIERAMAAGWKGYDHGIGEPARGASAAKAPTKRRTVQEMLEGGSK